MRSGFEAAAAAGLLLAVAATAGGARAAGSATDPSYGRVEGDIGVVLGVGAVAAAGEARAEGEVRVRYLDSAGVFVSYEDAKLWGGTPQVDRALTTGLELRPLFLFRWLQGHELRRARFDLMLDSLGVQLAALFEQPSGRDFASRQGMEVGLGLECPLVESASGPWVGLRAALRWTDSALSSGLSPGDEDRQAVLSVSVAWHQILAAHLVDAGDRAPR